MFVKCGLFAVCSLRNNFKNFSKPRKGAGLVAEREGKGPRISPPGNLQKTHNKRSGNSAIF